MNITDVDDKILAAAREQDEDPILLARRFEQEFWQDWDALGCLRPHVVTRVTEHVESDIVPYIEQIVQNGMAYVLDDGVYFDVREYESQRGAMTKYGKLAPPSAATDFFSTHSEKEKNRKKRDERDFVLWKLRKEDETLFWSSPWGQGRPGWHIECSAMIEAVQKQFKDTNDILIHAGGVDLKFPHHTNEIAQAEAYQDRGGREWIPHWVHTGHLHIDGMKMSKSLKNFITVQEMLSESDEGSALSSPADDFRLWCLGLSGSYRAPAVYSRDRMKEARSMREKLVRFLLDGSDWVRASEKENPAKRWTDEEYQLFVSVGKSCSACRSALLGANEPSSFDLDGSTFVEELVKIADICNAYVMSKAPGSSPAEPVLFALRTLRDMLSLVGFSDATVLAGLDVANMMSLETRSRVVGGEERLADEAVRFRARVREAALAILRGESKEVEAAQQILDVCDDAREKVFPSIGLELIDGKEEKAEEDSSWRFCIPRRVEPPLSSPQPSTPPLSLDVPVEDFFRVGQYEDKFSEYDNDGVPVRNADGSEVSKRLRKKLLKKREKHKLRVANRPDEK